MDNTIHGFLFSKTDRIIVPLSILTICLLIMLLLILMYFASPIYRSLLLYSVLMLFFAIGYLCIHYLRNKKFYDTQYTINDTSICLHIGSHVVSISTNENFNVCVLPLFKAGGKRISYINYFVFWRDLPPDEKVHPFKLLRQKTCILLPCNSDVECRIKVWSGCSEIPKFPSSWSVSVKHTDVL
jgi:amino acid transporter